MALSGVHEIGSDSSRGCCLKNISIDFFFSPVSTVLVYITCDKFNYRFSLQTITLEVIHGKLRSDEVHKLSSQIRLHRMPLVMCKVVLHNSETHRHTQRCT